MTESLKGALDDIGLNIVDSGDDAGTSVENGQFSVGLNSAGAESVLGEGDSYPVPVAYHCDTANTTGLVITSATDVSETLQSDSSSTTGLFDGVTAGKYLLVGSDYTFGGVKAKIDTLGTVEAANVVGEYLEDNAPTWENATYMATDAEFPYDQKGNVLASCSSCSEQWRFGFNPVGTLPTPWEKVELTINGVAITKYWARLRVTSAITTDPVMQQIKLHTNRWECNADGNTEYFGRARYPRTIPVTKHTNADKNPANENISIASGITEVRADNEFNNGANDGLILRGVMPVGIDSSIPVQVIVDWYAKTAVDGDVELEFEVVAATDGFVYDGSATPVAATPVVTSVLSTEVEKKFRSTFVVPVVTALPGDIVYGSLFRDGTAGNLDDTYAGNIVITSFRVVGYFWRP